MLGRPETPRVVDTDDVTRRASDDSDALRADKERPHASDSTAADLVRQARAATKSRYRAAPHGSFRRAVGRVGEGLGDFLSEMVVAGLSIAAFSGVAAATWYGWQHTRLATVGVYLAVFGFLFYGASVFWRARRSDGRPVSRGKLAAAAASTVAVVAIWLSYVAIYHY
jgi:hypothetical protein